MAYHCTCMRKLLCLATILQDCAPAPGTRVWAQYILSQPQRRYPIVRVRTLFALSTTLPAGPSQIELGYPKGGRDTEADRPSQQPACSVVTAGSISSHATSPSANLTGSVGKFGLGMRLNRMTERTPTRQIVQRVLVRTFTLPTIIRLNLRRLFLQPSLALFRHRQS